VLVERRVRVLPVLPVVLAALAATHLLVRG
jgi:hypothetical protein